MAKRDFTTDDIALQAAEARALLDALHNDDDDDLRHDHVEGETDLFEAIDRALFDMGMCDAQAIGIERVIDRLNARRKRAKDRIEKIRGAIEQAMQVCELPTIKRPTATLTVKKTPPKPLEIDESAVPSEFFAPQPPKLDKRALAEAAKNGPVPGVTMSNGGISLQIRRA